MKMCSKCEYETTDDKLFCYMDGTRLEPMDMCSCNRALGEFDRFCETCGKDNPRFAKEIETARAETDRARRDLEASQS